MATLLQHRLDPASRLARLMLSEYGVPIDLEEAKPWLREEEILIMNPAASGPILLDEKEPPAVPSSLDEKKIKINELKFNRLE